MLLKEEKSKRLLNQFSDLLKLRDSSTLDKFPFLQTDTWINPSSSQLLKRKVFRLDLSMEEIEYWKTNQSKENRLFRKNSELKQFRDLEMFTTNRISLDLWSQEKTYKLNLMNLSLNFLKMKKLWDLQLILKTNTLSNIVFQFPSRIKDLLLLPPKSDMMCPFSTISTFLFNKRIAILVVVVLERSAWATPPTFISTERKFQKTNGSKNKLLINGVMSWTSSEVNTEKTPSIPAY